MRGRPRGQSSRTLTENCAPTYSTSSDPRVDFFFHITEDAEQTKTIDLLSKSWKCNPLDTLKLIAFLRDCRKGKGIRQQYQMSLVWLFDNHYQTLFENMDQLVSFGYWKDSLHLLMILLFDGLIPDYLAKDDGRQKSHKRKKGKHVFPLYDRLVLRGLRKERQKRMKEIKAEKKAKTEENVVKSPNIEIPEELIESTDEGVVQTVMTRSEALQEKRRIFAKKHYKSDEKYRKIYDKIVEMFSKQLKRDLENKSQNEWILLNRKEKDLEKEKSSSEAGKEKESEKDLEMESEKEKSTSEAGKEKESKSIKPISLAGKWAPTNGHHFDKYLGISEAIGRQLCQLLKKDQIINDSTLVSVFYQKEVCAPIRKYLKIPEVFMSAKLWSDIEYNRVPSKCMQKNKSVFIKHDKQRFEEYLASKKTISGAVLKPVELVDRGFKLLDQALRRYQYDEEQVVNETEEQKDVLEKEVLEKQWLSMTENIKKSGGLLNNSIAICDVSGSMNGTPMSAAIGLTILTMSLSNSPWNSLCITFSATPEFHELDPNQTFIEKLDSIRHMKWGYNTNLNAVFKLLLDKALAQRLTNEQMPKVLLVFTDMEFDEALPGTSLTNFEAAKQLFANSGYKLPPIVFWNLKGNTSLTSTPVQTNELGTVLLSGYSGNQLSLISKCKDFENMSPYSMMRSAIDNKSYAKLKIVD